ncbi:MAG: hypothetical protein IKD66_11330, partial [Solobacterium sp.]|nr:hypothetical protein [Solobacterium sp.]
MKKITTAIAALVLLASATTARADGSVGDAGVVMDFNRDGVTDSRDWDAMHDWVVNYKMNEDKETNYANQEVPASINLLIDRDFATTAKPADVADLSSVPQYYLPTLGDTTPIKDQAPFGTCWAFGSIATLESNLLHKRHGNSGVVNPAGFEMNFDNVSKDLDLSELYHAYMNAEPVADGTQAGEGNRPLDPNADNANFSMGGFTSSTQNLFTSWISPLAESQEPYTPISAKNGGSVNIYGLRNPEEDKTSPRMAHVQELLYIDSPSAYHIDLDRKKYVFDNIREDAVNNMKQAMIQYGALMIAYQADTSLPGETGNGDYMNYEHWCQYDDSTDLSMNHMVTVVGWDDNFPKENFKTGKGGMPSQNGAFLIKNSWSNYDTNVERYGDAYLDVFNMLNSTESGKGAMSSLNYGIPDENGHGSGYSWVSYEDHSVLSVSAIDADDAVDGFEHDYIYQYDFTNPISFMQIAMPTNNAETKIANIFTSERDETLMAVSAYAPENNTTAEIEIYRVGADVGDPTTGELLGATTAFFDYRGFHTVRLDSPAELKKGDRFAVVERILTEKDGNQVSWLNLEETIRKDLQTKDNINTEITSVLANEGETLIYVNNGSEYVWADATEMANTDAAKVMSFGNAYIKAFTVTPEHAPLPNADPSYQGVYPGDPATISQLK